MSNGRRKGSKAELEVCADIKRWWDPVEVAEWARTPLSGGWGKPQVRAGFRASGDLMTTAERFPFVVEVKRREGWAWSTLAAGRPCPVWGWWRQAIKSAREMGGVPLLFFRKNNEPWWAMLPVKFTVTREVLLLGRWHPVHLARVDYGGELPTLFLASDFFAWSPTRFARGIVAGRGAHDGTQ